MIAVWLLVTVVGLAIAVAASRRATTFAQVLALRAGVPPLVIGLTVVGIGTNLPEIANSIVASLSDHGDLNAGAAIGSVAVDVTLVLGLLPLAAGAFYLGRIDLRIASLATIAALLFGLWLVSDGELSRTDGAALVLAWIAGSTVLWATARALLRAEVAERAEGSVTTQLLALLGTLTLVAVGATVAVTALINIAEIAGLPEYAISFFGTSIGTSLPELTVDIAAVRRRAWGLALGDVFGSAFSNATLTLGVGPLAAPTAIDADLATRGSIGALFAVAFVAIVLWRRKKLARGEGAVLLLAYALLYPLVLVQ